MGKSSKGPGGSKKPYVKPSFVRYAKLKRGPKRSFTSLVTATCCDSAGPV